MPPPEKKLILIDPSEVYRPEDDQDGCKKEKEWSRTDKDCSSDFRNYEENLQTNVVRNTYTLMHTYQTMEVVKGKIAKWGQLNKTRMSIMDALSLLDCFIDESDPDTDLPNSIHGYQTAERIREVHPDKEWLQCVGLVHDLGKVLALWGEPQWAVVGDTFPLGCKFSSKIVFADAFVNNPDIKNPLYNSKYGIYGANCGLDNVTLSWGHDEYMYQVLKGNDCKIPEEGLYLVRYHSFYPWHRSGEYEHLCSDHDREMLPWLKEFSSYDLYSKSGEVPDLDAIKPYYEELINKYCPGNLRW